MTEARNVDFGLSVSWGILAQFTMAAIGFVGTIIFARILGPTSFGAYYILFSLVKLADRPVSGVGLAVKKRLSEDSVDIRGLLGVGISVYALVGLAGTLGVVLFEEQLVQYTGLPNAGFVFISLFLTLGLFELAQKALSATGVVGKTLWIDTIRSVLTFGAQLWLVLAGYGAAGMAYGLVIATVLTIVLTIWSLGRLPGLPSRDQISSVLEFGKFSVPNSFLNKTYRQYDTLLIGWLIAPGAAGQYEVAFKLTVPAAFVAGTIGSGLMPKVSNLRSVGEAFSEHITNSLAFTSIIAIPIFFGSLAIPKGIVLTVYGSEYRPAVALLAGLALFQLFLSQSRVLSTTINAIDRPDWTMRVNVFMLVINVLLGYALVLSIGAIGAVYATVFSEAVRYVAHARFVTRDYDVELLPTPLRRQVLSGGAMFAVVEAWSRFQPIDSWLPLTITLVLGGATYFVTLSAISPQFRGTAIQILRKMLI